MAVKKGTKLAMLTISAIDVVIINKKNSLSLSLCEGDKSLNILKIIISYYFIQ